MNQDSNTLEGLGFQCECCVRGHLETRFREETITHETDTQTITILAERVPVRVCDECGSVFVTGETARVRHEYICRAVGAITPAEIKAIRDRHGLTQLELARLTKLGEASLSRWERGRLIPNPSNSTYLRLLLENPHLVESLAQAEAKTVQGR